MDTAASLGQGKGHAKDISSLLFLGKCPAGTRSSPLPLPTPDALSPPGAHQCKLVESCRQRQQYISKIVPIHKGALVGTSDDCSGRAMQREIYLRCYHCHYCCCCYYNDDDGRDGAIDVDVDVNDDDDDDDDEDDEDDDDEDDDDEDDDEDDEDDEEDEDEDEDEDGTTMTTTTTTTSRPPPPTNYVC